MSTDFEKGLRKTIDLSVKSKVFTADVLRSAMQDFLSGKSQRKGKVSIKQLSEHSGKLENVEIKCIADFLSMAKKYDIDYAVKKEAGSDTFHVFFQAGKMEDFRRAFQEFASRKQEELLNPRAEIVQGREYLFRNVLTLSRSERKADDVTGITENDISKVIENEFFYLS